MSKALISTSNLMPSLSGSGSLDAYIQAANRVPMLTPEEETELATRLQADGDIKSAQRMVLSHLRFVIKVAHNYSGYGLAVADLIQEGNIGLMKAVKRFDPTVGVRLVSFAVHWIKAEIHEFILRNWRIVKVATTKAQRKLFFKLRSQKKRLGWFRQDEVEHVADVLGVTPAHVREMESRLNNHDIAFDRDDDDGEENYNAPSLTLASNTESPEQAAIREDNNAHHLDQLKTGLQALDDRSRDIIKNRWLTENKLTLHELAKQYSVSAERIRQIENAAIKKLKVSFMEA